MGLILEQLIKDEEELASTEKEIESNGYLSSPINIKEKLQNGYVTSEQHLNRCKKYLSKKLAVNYMNQDSIFILIVFTYQNYKRRYPKYSVSEHTRFYCSSLLSAEKLIERILDPRDENDEFKYFDPIHHFIIEEISYDTPEYKYTNKKLYDHQGKFIDQTLCPGYSEQGVFKGRPYSMMRFNIGDIVEIYNEYTKSVELGFVVHCPIDERRGRSTISLDDSDDVYVVLTSHNYMESHDHVSPLDLFNPLFKIPYPTLNRLEKELLKYQMAESDYLKKECCGKYLILTDEKLGVELIFAKWEKRNLPFDCSFVHPCALKYLINRDIRYNKDNRSFFDEDGKCKIAFIIEKDNVPVDSTSTGLLETILIK